MDSKRLALVSPSQKADSTLETRGFQRLPGFLGESWRQLLVEAMTSFTVSDVRAGLRNAEQQIPQIAAYLNSAAFHSASQAWLGPRAQRMRVILFNKTPMNNWQVAWHQDKTSVVLDSLSTQDGFSTSCRRGLTDKAGIAHGVMPHEVLQQMRTLRIHLDAADRENACLRVIPGSHRLGILSPKQIKQQLLNQAALDCEMRAGDALLMSPLLLHASAKSQSNRPRRVIHVEFYLPTNG